MPVALLDLGDKGIAHHDFWHAPRELQDIVPHPIGGLFVRSKRCIGAIEDADSDQQIRAAIEEIIALASGTKSACTRLANSSTEPRLTLYFRTLANILRSPSVGTDLGSNSDFHAG
jgi:hypothetical protein